MSRVKRGVTNHARHKKVLKAAEGFYGRRKNTIRAAKAAVDKAGRVVVTNERADLALGGRPTPGDAAPDTLRAAVDAVKRRAAVRDLDVKAGEWSPTGDSRTLVVRAAPVESGGQVTGAAAIVEDVTDQREREARAQRLGGLQQQLVAVLDDAAHVVRQPAVGERHVAAALQDDDLRVLVQPTKPGRRAHPAGDTPNNHDSHAASIYPPGYRCHMARLA